MLKLCGKLCRSSRKSVWTFCRKAVETLRNPSGNSIENSVELLWKLCGNVMEKWGTLYGYGNSMEVLWQILWDFCLRRT